MAKRKPALLKVVVNRKRWYRGHGDGHSALLLSNNKMCCIGFLARELGCTPKDIRCQATLDDVGTSISYDFASIHVSILNRAYDVNDRTAIADDKRERMLITLGKQMGVQFQFIN